MVERSNWCEKGESVHDHELAMVNPVGTIPSSGKTDFSYWAL